MYEQHELEHIADIELSNGRYLTINKIIHSADYFFTESLEHIEINTRYSPADIVDLANILNLIKEDLQ